jgi:hypothetical protein
MSVSAKRTGRAFELPSTSLTNRGDAIDQPLNRKKKTIKYRSFPRKDPLHVPAQRPYKGGDDDHKQHVLNCAVEIHQPYSGAVRPRRRQNNYRVPECALCTLYGRSADEKPVCVMTGRARLMAVNHAIR